MSSFEPGHVPRTVPASPELRERDARLESLKAIAGRLAHDFNNFLVPLFGYVTLIKEEVPHDSAAMKYADTMERAARKTENFLDVLLLAVRPQRYFNPTEVNLKALIEDCLGGWIAALPATAQISVRVDLQDCTLFLDENQWRTVMRELLNNAHFALATGGALEISLLERKLSFEEAAALNVRGSDFFELRIKDNGFGMAKPVLQRACEPFFTTRSATRVAGLGLTTVHSVVQSAGGQMVLESTEDVGTTISLWIPVKSPWSNANPSAPAALSETAHLGSRILLVEDDPLVREVIRSCLEKTNLEVHVAVDGEEGLKLFEKYASEIALVVSDIMMPAMDGLEMYKAIRRQDPSVRVILLSGAAEVVREEALAEAGGERPLLMKKPFTLKAFNEVIRTHLASR